MKTQIVDRTDEKIALAREVGMAQWAQHVIRVREEVAALTNIRFKPTTYEAIERMLCNKRVFKPYYYEDVLVWAVVVGTIGAFGLIMYFLSIMNHIGNWADFKVWLGVLGGFETLLFVCSSFPKLSINSKHLHRWTDNIPYGALLAVKEAKDAGIGSFRIYYPVFESRRVLADPVITGKFRDSEQELMIFAWDDGKVYE